MSTSDIGDTHKPLRVLSLDGGGSGIRGLSSLLLLRELMTKLALSRGVTPPTCLRPSDYFDLIIGTGTGGISALFLGRMRMTVEEAIQEYMIFANTAFQPSRSKIKQLFQFNRSDTSVFDSHGVQHFVGDAANRFLGNYNAVLEDDLGGCRTAVLACTSDDIAAPAYVFRSYSTDLPASRFAVHEIACATIAIGGLFPPVILGDPPMSYINAGNVDYTNPARIAWTEAERILPGFKENSVTCLVSIGTGLHKVAQTEKRWAKLINISERIVMQCEAVHSFLSQWLQHAAVPYFRFNIPWSFDAFTSGHITLDFEEQLTGITGGYVQQLDIELSFDLCVKILNDKLHSTQSRQVKYSQLSILDHQVDPFIQDSKLCLDGCVHRDSIHPSASGGYADVYEGYFENSRVAIKVMRLFGSNGRKLQHEKLIRRLWREYLAWSCLSHPNILPCLGYSYDFSPPSSLVPSLVSPWMDNGTIISYIEDHPDADHMKLISGIAHGLCYLHTHEPVIIHGDLRAGNILVSDLGIPFLSDFGLSRILGEVRGMTTSSELAGSVRWMSPELFDSNSNVTVHSDVWAFGMTILEILTGKPPYANVRPDVLVHIEIKNSKLPPHPQDPKALGLLNAHMWYICQCCWSLKPTARPSMQEVLLMIDTKLCIHPCERG